MPQASNSVGSILKIGVTPVAKLTKITAPEMSKAEIDVTTLDSTGGYKEFIPDFRDGGSVMIEGFAISDVGQAALKANFDADTLTNFTIETPNGLTITFSGYVSKYKKGDAAVSQGITFTGELRVSGVVSFAEVASTGCSAIAIEEAGAGALTAYAITPAFAIGKYKYTATFTTESSVEVIATNATPNTTLELYVDGEFAQVLTSATPSTVSIPMSAGDVKLITVLTWQTDKSPLTYDIMLARIS
jgi:predicted secreted protein